MYICSYYCWVYLSKFLLNRCVFCAVNYWVIFFFLSVASQAGQTWSHLDSTFWVFFKFMYTKNLVRWQIREAIRYSVRSVRSALALMRNTTQALSFREPVSRIGTYKVWCDNDGLWLGLSSFHNPLTYIDDMILATTIFSAAPFRKVFIYFVFGVVRSFKIASGAMNLFLDLAIKLAFGSLVNSINLKGNWGSGNREFTKHLNYFLRDYYIVYFV